MPYNTGNAMPSKDPRDLHDNASNFDSFSNGSAATYLDRFGVPRRSLAGVGMAFDESQLARDAQFQAFLAAAGYVWIGDYAAGVTFTARNQYVVRSGSQYRVAPTVSLPLVLTGTWATDQPMLVLMETAGTIMSQLAANTGAGLIGTTESITVQAALDARLKSNIFASSTNLNTLYSPSSVGIYRQSSDASATLALNYPVAGVGGTLAVYIGVSNLALQEFTTKTLRKFIRWCSAVTGPTWTPWREVTMPLGGNLGQSLVRSADGVVWGSPSAPKVMANLFVTWRNFAPTARVQASALSVTDVNGNSVCLFAFDQGASSGGATGVANSLDTGAWYSGAGSVEYHLFAIYNPVSDTRALLWSLSPTAPMLPTGYTHFSRVGANIYSSAGPIMGDQIGRKFYVQTPSLSPLASGVVGSITQNAVGWATSSVTGVVPSTAKEILLQISAVAGTGSASNLSLVAVAPTNTYGAVYSISPPWCCNWVSGGAYLGVFCTWLPLISRAVFCASSASGGRIMVAGWEDNL